MTLRNIEESSNEPNFLSFLTDRNLFALKDLLERIWQPDGLFSDTNNKETLGVLNFIQVALTQGAAKKLYENIDHQNPNRELLIFIAVLIIVNKMAKGEDTNIIGWAIKESKIKVLTDKIIDQLKYVFSEYQFSQISNQAIHYVVTFKSQIFTEEFEKDIAQKINVPLEEMKTYWKKFLACVAIMEIEVEETINKLPLEKIKKENVLLAKVNNNVDKQLKNLLSESQHILNALNTLNELNCSVSKKYHEISMLRLRVELQCQKLKSFKKTHFSIFNIQIDQFIYHLNFELYSCYLQIAKSNLKLFGFFKRKTLISSLQNAFHCLTKLMIYYIKQYSHLHEGLWQEIHELYNLSLKAKLEKHKLGKVNEWHNQFSTIEEIYKYSLLLGTINFSQFRHEEISQIIYACERWVNFLYFEPKISNDKFYVVNPHQDKGPQLNLNNQNQADIFYLNYKKLIEHLSALLTRNPMDRKSAKLFTESELLLSRYLTEKLLAKWKNLEEAKETFKPVNTPIELSFGISHEMPFLHKTSEKLHKNEDPNVIEIYDCNVLSQDCAFNAKKIQNETKYRATIIEENDKCIMIKWQAAPPYKIQPGQFVSVFISKDFRIGIIKSLFLSESNNLYLTIRLFPKEVKLFKAHLAQDAFSPSFTIFLVPEHVIHNRPMTIIAPQVAFKEGDEIRITSPEMEGVILLGDPLKVYQDYQQFSAKFI
ncbi:MAG: hypothetical protein JSR17_12780 [Proteobacteria bacterium]|nr:hypothetical protein [Pseudomonadota bacterium]